MPSSLEDYMSASTSIFNRVVLERIFNCSVLEQSFELVDIIDLFDQSDIPAEVSDFVLDTRERRGNRGLHLLVLR